MATCRLCLLGQGKNCEGSYVGRELPELFERLTAIIQFRRFNSRIVGLHEFFWIFHRETILSIPYYFVRRRNAIRPKPIKPRAAGSKVAGSGVGDNEAAPGRVPGANVKMKSKE